MALSKEKAEKIKEHLYSQLKHFPEEKRTQIKEAIKNLTEKELEKFLEQNNLTHLKYDCIFCAIANKSNPAVIIAEDNLALAVLELNPLSKGHTLVIPKNHEASLKESVWRIEKIVKDKLKTKFAPKEIRSNEIKIMDHPILEIIPLYGNETQRRSASESELQKIKEELLSPPAPVKKEIQKNTDKKEVFKAKPRIP